MRALIAALLAILLTTAAFAQESREYLIFRNGAVRTNEVALTTPGYVSSPDIQLEWTAVNGDRIPEHYRRDGSAVVYDPPAPAPPGPDPDSFIDMIIDDVNAGTLPTAAAQHLTLLKQLVHDSNRLKGFWAKVKGGLNSTQQQAVKKHAASARITLGD